MKKNLGFIIALLAAISWGWIYAYTEKIVERLSPVSTMIVFYYLGSLLMIPLLPFYFKEITSETSSISSLPFVVTIIATILAEFLIIWSIKLLGGVEAGLIEISYPLFTAIFLFLIANKTPDISSIIGGIFVFIGISILTIF
jgi:drug/metabolite transporter (DMT)-like permease